MRVLGVTETCDLGALYLALIGEGHEVRVSVSEPLATGTMAGMVPRVEDWRAALPWVREAGADGLILFEAVSEGFGALQDELRREGYRVIGGSALGDRLENDRAFGQEVLAKLGLPIAESHAFTTAAEARDHLRAHPRRTVLKVNGGETYAGQLPDGSDVSAMLDALPGSRSLILQAHLEGVETGVGAFFNGRRFLQPACLDWEHKRFFAGDMGELTGEMGTVATYTHSGRMLDELLAPLEPLLAEAGHVGWVNLNTVVNEEGIWPLEFTCRFGYPGFAVLAPLQACSWGELLQGVADPDARSFPVQAGFSVGVVVTTPPFPYSRHEVEEAVGLPVLVQNDLDLAHLHWGEVGMADSRLVTSGLYGWTAVVTGTGMAVAEARTAAYRNLRGLTVPNGRYRLDIGEQLIAGGLERLTRLAVL